ncbi:hypothetical protein NQ318_020586 [Aromia moschata]|uniref:Cysteine-rich PDZ-binding protein n=1 Tax=Aromia moschata TaxID=1265417 RepID=A0AAV8Z0M9_9CUCU|nr:hypothetical protein NQ318_020586 [Aromia moschata]
MVCDQCQKKCGKVITPDPWKSGARNTTESGGRKNMQTKGAPSRITLLSVVCVQERNMCNVRQKNYKHKELSAVCCIVKTKIFPFVETCTTFPSLDSTFLGAMGGRPLLKVGSPEVYGVEVTEDDINSKIALSFSISKFLESLRSGDMGGVFVVVAMGILDFMGTSGLFGFGGAFSKFDRSSSIWELRFSGILDDDS